MATGTLLITGGQGDLARSIASLFSDIGWEVHAPGKDELDVRSKDSVLGWMDANPAAANADLLVNNAGLANDVLLARMDESTWDCSMEINLKGAFLASQAVLRGMMKRRAGHIVNIGSFSALWVPPGQAAYASAKAGLIGLTKSLASEVGSRNVRVNCVLPGFLETKMTSGLPEQVRKRALEMHALGRFNTPEDVARFMLTLHEMKSVSGQIFQLDSRITGN